MTKELLAEGTATAKAPRRAVADEVCPRNCRGAAMWQSEAGSVESKPQPRIPGGRESRRTVQLSLAIHLPKMHFLALPTSNMAVERFGH